MDELSALRLQLEWGADESLAERPVDRRAVADVAVPARAAEVRAAPSRPVATPGVALSARAAAEALAAAADSPAALHAALRAFEGCALRTTATNLIFAEGNPAGRVMLIADVPGAAEDRAGVPFAGASAAFLDRMLASAGLDRAAWLATSLLPWRPPGDRKPSEAELEMCLPFLLRHVALLQPRRVVMFGTTAARTLLAAAASRRGRRGWQELAIPGLSAAIPALALPTPAHIQATPGAKRETWAELIRLRRAMDGDHG